MRRWINSTETNIIGLQRGEKMETPNSVRYFQRLNEMVKELAKEAESEKKEEERKCQD